MKNLNQKLEYLKWLRSIGIGYYFSEKKDSDICNFFNHHHIPGVLSKRILPNNVQDSSVKSMSQAMSQVMSQVVAKPEFQESLDKSSSISSRALANSAKSLEELKTIVYNFDGCSLKDFAINTVFSDGNPLAKIMLVGEAPGAKEDELGIPFCGESGMLLDTMLMTIGLSRKENIYITNTVFWRPPANRRPTNQEMEVCRPLLEKHIALINPELIICVGSTAVNDLLGDKITISLARNNIYKYQNTYLEKPINTMSIFHPAYLLRQSEKKKDMWFDLIKIQQFIKENL